MQIEGAPPKRFHVYSCDIDNNPHAREGEYDTLEELRAHRWRLDRRYKIRVAGKFFERKEFFAWIKLNPQ